MEEVCLIRTQHDLLSTGRNRRRLIHFIVVSVSNDNWRNTIVDWSATRRRGEFIDWIRLLEVMVTATTRNNWCLENNQVKLVMEVQGNVRESKLI